MDPTGGRGRLRGLDEISTQQIATFSEIASKEAM